MKVVVWMVVFVLMIFSEIALAAPLLHTHRPANNSYTTGGTILISINITDDNLNTSSAVARIIELGAYQLGEQWTTHPLSCSGSSPEWNCSTNFVTSTIGSDTVELFYFQANDTDGITGYDGTASSPLRFTIDREPPLVVFLNPTNGTYVSGNESLLMNVSDASSGVNGSTVQYSTDGLSWTAMVVSSNGFTAGWNTSAFSNNQTVTLTVRASDNVGNTVLSNATVRVDNELPQMNVSGLTGTLIGNAHLQANVSDGYSGVDLSNVKYSVEGLSGTLGCTGTNYSATCSAVLNTAGLLDENHTITYNVTDRAGNSNTSSQQITTRNTLPTVSIVEPSNNAFIKGIALVRTSLVNTQDVVKYVDVSIEQGGNISTKNMTCNSNITSCNYSLDTNLFVDGGYTIRVRVVNTLNADITSSITVTIDNTLPLATITQPTGTVSGSIEIKSDVVDTNLDQKNVTFSISTFTGNLTCTPQTPSRFICSSPFNSKQLGNGKYFLNMSAVDKAGNVANASQEITVSNQGGGTSSTGGGAGSVSGSGQSGGATEGVNDIEGTEERTTPPLQISLPFESKYIILGVVVASVLVAAVLLAVIAKHRLDKTIITAE